MPTTCYTHFPSPLGPLLLLSDGAALTGLYLPDHKGEPVPATDWQRNDAVFAAVCRQLAAYFAGEQTEFDLPLAPTGTEYQRTVWSELRRIPYGTTISYGELARRIGNPQASRAVGAANGRNPISIIVPCHRVIGHSGTLTGYGGGLDRKRWLLEHEARVLQPGPS